MSQFTSSICLRPVNCCPCSVIVTPSSNTVEGETPAGPENSSCGPPRAPSFMFLNTNRLGAGHVADNCTSGGGW